MTVYAITDTKKGRTGIAPTYLQVGAGAAGAAFSNTGCRAIALNRLFCFTTVKHLMRSLKILCSVFLKIMPNCNAICLLLNENKGAHEDK